MIVKSLTDFLFAFTKVPLLWLPQGDPPSQIADAGGALHTVLAYGNGLGAWIPWAYLATCATIAGTTWVALAAISGVRWVLSWLPTMG